MISLFKNKKTEPPIPINLNEGDLFEWNEPTASSIGSVISRTDIQLVLDCWPYDDEDRHRTRTFTLSGGIVLSYEPIEDTHPINLSSDYINKYFVFHRTAEEKKKFLSSCLSYQETEILPKYRKKLEFFENKFKKFKEMLHNIE